MTCPFKRCQDQVTHCDGACHGLNPDGSPAKAADLLELAGEQEGRPKSKRDVIRVGDTVRVLRPRWVTRVGYPLVWTDLVDEVRADPRTAEALKVLGLPDSELDDERQGSLVRAVAMARVEQRGFGGNARSIHYMPIGAEDDDPLTLISTNKVPCHGYVGRELIVTSKRVVKTGVRFPAWGSGSGPDYHYEPGGLDNCKTHVLLTTWAGEIEVCDVEKVTR